MGVGEKRADPLKDGRGGKKKTQMFHEQRNNHAETIKKQREKGHLLVRYVKRVVQGFLMPAQTEEATNLRGRNGKGYD